MAHQTLLVNYVIIFNSTKTKYRTRGCLLNISLFRPNKIIFSYQTFVNIATVSTRVALFKPSCNSMIHTIISLNGMKFRHSYKIRHSFSLKKRFNLMYS